MQPGKSSKRVPGKHEQELLHEDPGILAERGVMQDPASDRAIRERHQDELRQQFREWWSSLDEEQVLRYMHKRDELLLLLHEKYRYTPDEASREADAVLKREWKIR